MIDLTRQSDIIPSEKVAATSVCIVGAGAIGSHAAGVLTKMGIQKLRVVDFDDVEEHNIANQGFGLDEIGLTKVGALRDRVKRTTGVEIEAVNARITSPPTFDQDIVISAVDSMAVRKLLWDGFTENSYKSFLFLDGRMGAMYGTIFMIPKDDDRKVRAYAESLHEDSEGVQAPCTARATIFCAEWMSSMLGSACTKYVTGREFPVYRMDMDFHEDTLHRFK